MASIEGGKTGTSIAGVATLGIDHCDLGIGLFGLGRRLGSRDLGVSGVTGASGSVSATSASVLGAGASGSATGLGLRGRRLGLRRRGGLVSTTAARVQPVRFRGRRLRRRHRSLGHLRDIDRAREALQDLACLAGDRRDDQRLAGLVLVDDDDERLRALNRLAFDADRQLDATRGQRPVRHKDPIARCLGLRRAEQLAVGIDRNLRVGRRADAGGNEGAIGLGTDEREDGTGGGGRLGRLGVAATSVSGAVAAGVSVGGVAAGCSAAAVSVAAGVSGAASGSATAGLVVGRSVSQASGVSGSATTSTGSDGRGKDAAVDQLLADAGAHAVGAPAVDDRRSGDDRGNDDDRRGGDAEGQDEAAIFTAGGRRRRWGFGSRWGGVSQCGLLRGPQRAPPRRSHAGTASARSRLCLQELDT